jgi:hypothetical protein
MPLIEQFSGKLCDEYLDENVREAILLTNNASDTRWWTRAADVSSAICCKTGRISFYNRAGTSTAPTHGQTFFYFGDDVRHFHSVFSKLGPVFPHWRIKTQPRTNPTHNDGN